ncbi:MAG: DNA repair protein RecN [Eubacterium sp.]|nr:DNA repair protein RecN [Eubacterium sp.]
MLINLHVKNLALIEETEIDFTDHLNILTGETGAGKSILIGSIQSALGGRIPKDMIRNGSDSALIELIFQTESDQVKGLMEDYEIPFEDGEIIIQRRITNQRVVNKVNGTSVTISRLKELSPFLLDLSGQHENQLLLKPANHLKILDSYARQEIGPVREQTAAAYSQYHRLAQELSRLNIGEEERLREMEFLKYEIREIEGASLQPGEDEELEQLFEKISHSRDILSACGQAHYLTSEGNNSAASQIGEAIRSLTDASAYDDDLAGLLEQASTVDALLNDFNRDLADYIASMEFDEETFHETEERLDQINHLKAKYGDGIPAIFAYLDKSRKRYDELTHHDEHIEKLRSECDKAENELKSLSNKLSSLRKKAAVPLAQSIRQALLDLNFNDVRFEIAFEEREEAGRDGIDSVCFMISTNPGLPMRPLHEIASGGELSRIMLAIKSILADEEQIETLIFDEIDTGISGRTAQKVSERLSSLASGRQVIAITHLPQIAAMADSHYLIEKTSSENSTISQIIPLNEEESVEELARMLGGSQITETVLENAREMKKLARAGKNILDSE